MNSYEELINKMLVMATFLAMVMFASYSQAERIKDIASLQGVRTNQIIGYGLVVGLNGTGDQVNQAEFTIQSFKNLLNRFGIRVPDNINVQTNTIAAVMITADLPPFAKPGKLIDVTVSAIGNSKSLRGGTLLMTPLKGADGNVYAVSQGNLIVSGFGYEGADGSKIIVNVPSVGRIPNGATVERPSPTAYTYNEVAIYNLHTPDFTTAVRLADVINSNFSPDYAKALDASSIAIHMPKNNTEQISLLASIENLELEPGDSPAKVIINARTGTVVIGQHVLVKPAIVSHGNLNVTISEKQQVSQPSPFSLVTNTTVTPSSQVQAVQEDKRAFLFDPGVNLKDIVQAINAVGASPSDLVAILDSLRMAGALRGEIEII